RHDRDHTLAVGTARKAGGAGAPAARPPGALWGLPRAAQPPTWGDHPHATPAGCGRGGGETWHPVLAVGQAAGPRLWSGDGHLSVLPPWHAPDHGRHHPGVGDHAYLAASPARVRSPSHCPGPWSPRDIRVRLNPRPVAWARRCRARRDGVWHLWAPCHPV